MKFNNSVTELIESRSSWRTYKPESLTQEIRKKLEDVLDSNTKGPFGENVRFQLVDLADTNETQKLGTYGVIKGAQTFIVGAMEKTEKGLENYGYLFEKIILHATDLGLGTCWLGGSFTRSTFAARIDLKQEESIPAITPVGYVANKRSVVGKAMRIFVGAKKRKPWEEIFFDLSKSKVLPKAMKQEDVDEYREILEMVRLAPSASNKQPWLIVRDTKNNAYHFYLNYSKNYNAMVGFDIQSIDMGIAMCHFELTARKQDIQGAWVEMDPYIEMPQKNAKYIISWLVV